MIKIWLSREESIPIREQLSSQLILGIVSKRIHANAVSAAYRALASRGWLTERKGSGVFVRDIGLPDRPEDIESFVQTWIEAAAAHA